MNPLRTHLAALLAAHPPHDAREEAFLQQMLVLCALPTDATGRNHFDPGHFTASAFVLSPDEADVLLIFHGKLHLWLQPGGHIDPTDADVVAAALREVEEETSLKQVTQVGDGLFDVDIHTIPARKGDPAHEHFDLRILLKAGTRDITAGDDAIDARWAPLNSINAQESDESVLRAIRKIRSR